MKSVKVPALELFLHEMIPLAKAMGVTVECVINGHCYDGCGPYGTTVATLPDGTQYRGEFACCGWSPVTE